MSEDLYGLFALEPKLPNWGDRFDANMQILNSLTQRRFMSQAGEPVLANQPASISSAGGAIKGQAIDGRKDIVGLFEAAAGTSDNVRVITHGLVTDATWAWSAPRKWITVSASTAGQLVELVPGAVGPIVGITLSTTSILVHPIPLHLVNPIGAFLITTISALPSSADVGQRAFVTDYSTTGREVYYASDHAWRYVADDSLV